jgi:hypothetical protein
MEELDARLEYFSQKLEAALAAQAGARVTANDGRDQRERVACPRRSTAMWRS